MPPHDYSARFSRRRVYQSRRCCRQVSAAAERPWYATMRRCGQLNLNERDPLTLDVAAWLDYWAGGHVPAATVRPREAARSHSAGGTVVGLRASRNTLEGGAHGVLLSRKYSEIARQPARRGPGRSRFKDGLNRFRHVMLRRTQFATGLIHWLTRYLSPVGSGTPPSGSIVTAIPIGCGRSTGVSNIVLTLPPGSGLNRPALIGAGCFVRTHN
jgi:hypothetical protein